MAVAVVAVAAAAVGSWTGWEARPGMGIEVAARLARCGEMRCSEKASERCCFAISRWISWAGGRGRVEARDRVRGRVRG